MKPGYGCCRPSTSTEPPTVADFFRLAAHKIRQVLLDMAASASAAATSARWRLERRQRTPLEPTAANRTYDPSRLALWTEFHEKVATLDEQERDGVRDALLPRSAASRDRPHARPAPAQGELLVDRGDGEAWRRTGIDGHGATALSRKREKDASERTGFSARKADEFLAYWVPGSGGWWLPRQVLGIARLPGIAAGRVPLFKLGSGRPTLPFRILGTSISRFGFWKRTFGVRIEEPGPARHNRYLEVPGFAPVLVTRDPAIIRAITTETGDGPGQFDRDTLPSTGIARATGPDTLLYANGPFWKKQRKLAASRSARPRSFSRKCSRSLRTRFGTPSSSGWARLQAPAKQRPESARVRLEPEIKAVMLEMLTNNFFGTEIPYEQLRNRYVPRSGTRDRAHRARYGMNKLGIPLSELPGFTPRIAQAKIHYASFDELTNWCWPCGRRERVSGSNSSPTCRTRPSQQYQGLSGRRPRSDDFVCELGDRAPGPQSRRRRSISSAAVKDIEDYTPENLDRARYLRPRPG